MFLFRYFDTDFIREALKSRLSLGMTSNKTYHFQTTANHHRFIKVWTSIADLPTSKFVVQTFFWKKYGSEIPYLPMIWTYVQIFVVFFLDLSPNGKDLSGVHHWRPSLVTNVLARCVLYCWPKYTRILFWNSNFFCFRTGHSKHDSCNSLWVWVNVDPV